MDAKGAARAEHSRLDWKIDGLWLAGLAILSLIFYRRAVFTDDGHVPFDIVGVNYALLFSVADAVRSASLPLWDAYSYSGTPLLGNIQAAALYPLNWLFMVPSLALEGYLSFKSVELILVFHYFLAAAFTYVFVRGLGVSRPAAAVSGVIYAFGGYYASQAQHMAIPVGSAWIPLGLHFLRVAIGSNRARYAIAAGLCFALNVLAGLPIITVPVVVLVAVCFLYWAGSCVHARFDWRKLRVVICQFVIMGIVAAGLSAVQMIPALETVANALGAGRSGQAIHAAWRPEVLLSYFLPNLFGATVGPPQFWAKGDPTQNFAYIGILPLILILLALASRHRRRAIVFACVAAFFLLWSLGRATPLAYLIYRVLPWPLNDTIEPFTSRAVADLFAGVVAGFGADHLLNIRGDRRRVFRLAVWGTVVASIVLAMVLAGLGHVAKPPDWPSQAIPSAMAGIPALILLLLISGGVIWSISSKRLNPRIAATVVLVFVVADLFYFNSEKYFNLGPGMPDEAKWSRDAGTQPLHELLKRDVEYTNGMPFRIDNTGATAYQWGTATKFMRLQNANGADPLLLRDYARYRDSFSQEGRPSGERIFSRALLSSRLLDLLNIKYIVLTGADVEKDLTRFDPSVSGSKYRLVMDNWYKVFENTEVLPRAFFVPAVKLVDSHESALQEIRRTSFDPRREVILEGAGKLLEERLGSGPSTTNEARIVRYTPNRVEIVTSQDSPGVLFLGDVFYPGWKVLVDGRASTVYRANFLFRAVYLDHGSHSVVFVYDPSSVKVGLGITAATVLAIIVVAAIRRRFERRRVLTTEVLAVHHEAVTNERSGACADG